MEKLWKSQCREQTKRKNHIVICDGKGLIPNSNWNLLIYFWKCLLHVTGIQVWPASYKGSSGNSLLLVSILFACLHCFEQGCFCKCEDKQRAVYSTFDKWNPFILITYTLLISTTWGFEGWLGDHKNESKVRFLTVLLPPAVWKLSHKNCVTGYKRSST